MSSSRRPGTTTAPLLDLRVERDAERHLHVGRGERELASSGAQEDPGEDLDGVRAETAAADELEALGELVPGARDLHRRCRHGIDGYVIFKKTSS